MQPKNLNRLLRALSRQGLDVSYENRTYSVRLANSPDAPMPHNITLPEGARWVIRKGATPAHAGQPVIIPGSMGAASFLLVGKGNPAFLASASHGAGRLKSRFELSRDGADKSESVLGLTGVDCITLREERRIEEAPAAYKPIQPVIDAQVEANIVSVVARIKPILTFKA